MTYDQYASRGEAQYRRELAANHKHCERAFMADKDESDRDYNIRIEQKRIDAREAQSPEGDERWKQ